MDVAEDGDAFSFFDLDGFEILSDFRLCEDPFDDVSSCCGV